MFVEFTHLASIAADDPSTDTHCSGLCLPNDLGCFRPVDPSADGVSLGARLESYLYGGGDLTQLDAATAFAFDLTSGTRLILEDGRFVVGKESGAVGTNGSTFA